MKRTFLSMTASALLASTLLASSALADLPTISGGDGFPTTPALEEVIDAIPIVPNLDMADASAMTVDQAAFAETFSHHRLPVGSERIHFVMGGDGPAVLLLHGWPTNWYEWVRMMPLLAQDYTVIVPDLPGVGRSSVPADPGVKRDVAQTMLDLMTALGHARFYVVGHDWGTPTAWAMGYLAPERIERMIVSESTIPGLDVPGFANWERFNSMWWHHTFHAAPDIPEMLIRGRERQYLDSKYREWVFNYEETFSEDFLDAFVEAYTQPGTLSGGFGFYRALDRDAEHNRAFMAEQGPFPVELLVVTGRYQVNEFLHRQIIPHADDVHSVIIDDAQHFLSIEAPLTFTQLVRDFFPDGDLDTVEGAEVQYVSGDNQ